MNRYARGILAAAVSSLLVGAAIAFIIKQASLWIAWAFTSRHTVAMVLVLPGPLGGWLYLWFLTAAILALFALPKSLIRARRILRRAPALNTFVLWRLYGLYELHHPAGGVVPVEDFGLRTWIRPRELDLAQWVASMEITQLTGRDVAEWKPDKVNRSLYDDSSWIARLQDRKPSEADAPTNQEPASTGEPTAGESTTNGNER